MPGVSPLWDLEWVLASGSIERLAGHSAGAVVVTGAGGFIGSHVVQAYLAEGRPVIGIDRHPLRGNPRDAGYVHYCEELPSARLTGIFERHQPALVVHAAGPASVHDSLADSMGDFGDSVPPVIDVLEAIRETGKVARFVFLSSAAVYGEPNRLPIGEQAPISPLSPYGWHKAMGELAVREYAAVFGLRTSLLRVFSAYGAGLRRQVMWDICQMALDRPIVDLSGSGEESRDFVHVRDVVTAIDAVLRRAPLAGECYNVASGESTSIGDLARWLVSALKVSAEIRFSQEPRRGDPSQWQADITALRGLGYSPSVSVEEGVAEYARWVKETLMSGIES